MGTSNLIFSPLSDEHIREGLQIYSQNFWTLDIPYSEKATTLEYWEDCLDASYGVVGHVDNEMVCFYWAVKMPYLFNDDLIEGQEMFWFMQPEYRKGKNFIRFLEQIEGVNNLNYIDFYSLNVNSSKLATGLEKYKYKPTMVTVRRDLNELY